LTHLGHFQSTHKGLQATLGEKEKEDEEFDIVFTEAAQPGEPVFQKVSTKKKKKTKKGKKRKRETLFRTKVRRRLLKEYHQLIAKRKKINRDIKANRRHRNQLVFHRK